MILKGWRPSAVMLIGIAAAAYAVAMGAWIVTAAISAGPISVTNRTSAITYTDMPRTDPVWLTPPPCVELEADADFPITLPKPRPAQAGPGTPPPARKRRAVGPFPLPPFVRED